MADTKKIGSSVGGTAGTAIGTSFGGPVGGAVGGAVGSAAGSVIGGLFGSSAASNAQDRVDASAQEAISRIEQGLTEYGGLTEETLGTVLDSLADGESEASDEIMAGLGMSIEERTKFFDIAKDNLDWVVDFGKARQGNFSESMESSEAALQQSGQFLNHYKDLVFNPDAIYDTEVYKSIKDRSVQEWGNFYSGKGLLGGSAQEGMVDRMSELAYGFLQGERNSALQGVNAGRSISDGYLNQAGVEQQAIGLGASASGQVANLAFQTGDANANDIMAAHGSLAGITQAFNPATFQYNSGQAQAETTANARTSQANAELASGLGQGQIAGDLSNGLIQAGVSAGTNIADLLTNPNSGIGNTVEDAKTGRQTSYAQNSPWVTKPTTGGILDKGNTPYDFMGRG